MKNILRTSISLIERATPHSEFWDNLIALKKFITCHRRMPSDKMLFNDVLYKIKTSNEIINPLRVFVSDKEFVKVYIKSVVGEKYNVPTLKILRSYEEAIEYSFPSNCCIKPTQASGKVILRENGSPVDFKILKSWFDLNYYTDTRERNYKNLAAKIIVEPLVFGDTDLSDYRFFCYQGKVKLISIDVGKYSGYSRAFYDLKWTQHPFSLKYPMLTSPMDKPENLDEMISVAEKLSEGFNFIRIDIYSNGKECLVGEITNCHASAGQSFIPASAEQEASKIIFG